MTPEQLKASILQYAIQGKLVEQRPEEGTGEELYRQIQAEKQRLIKEGKIKKEKALPEIAEDEIPFDLPDSWKWVRLNAVIVLLSGSDLTPNKYNNSCKGIPYITGASNIEGEKLVINRWTEYPNNIAHNGDLLLTCKGTVGKTTILNEPEVHIARQLMAITAIELNLKYLKYFVESHVDVLKAKAKSLIPGIERDNVLKLLLPLPPLAEQHRIVAKIEELLPYVDRYAAAYEKLEQFNAKFPEDMKKSILQYAIQGKLVEQRPEEGTGKELYRQIQAEKQRLIKTGKLKKTRALPTITGEEVPYDFPASWKVCYIDDIAFVTKLAGFEYTKYISDNLVPTGIPLFKGKNVQNGKLVLSFESYIPESVSDELPRSQITKKCLLTPYVGTIGNIAVFDGSFKAHLGSNVGKIELLNSDTQTFILEEYVLWYLKSTYGYAELTKYKKATAQESISIDAIRNVVIAIPPLEEQRRIVAKLEEILPLCERLK
mgnify:CR=1 FL=1